MCNRPMGRQVVGRVVWVLLLLCVAGPTRAQFTAPCGVVNAIDYPIDIRDTFARRFDDFARFRDRFGGLHVGIDLGFHREGEPVRAAARGRVTYADPAGWDTELGVVVVEHIFPDDSRYYSLYGHMVETPTIRFPVEGACVERGAIIGAIGDPARSAPHLHYEIRDFLPNDGGPGYVATNPLDQGWYHPLDFTERWRVQLGPGFVSATSADAPPALPPLPLPNGVTIFAGANRVAAFTPPDTLLWRVTTDGAVTGLAALPDNRVVVHTSRGQTITLDNGRYVALWTVESLTPPLVALGDVLVFAHKDGSVAAYTPLGDPLWSLPAPGGPVNRVFHFSTHGSGHDESISIGVLGDDGAVWRLIHRGGTEFYRADFAQPPLIAPNPAGGWLVLDGARLDRVMAGERWTIGATGQLAGRGGALTADILGNSYIYLDDVDSTLLSLGPGGELRWRQRYDHPPGVVPPLLATGNGCLLYALAVDGALSAFNSVDGALLHQVTVYAGGSRTGRPAARYLAVDRAERLTVGGGFLSVLHLDGVALNPTAAAACRLG